MLVQETCRLGRDGKQCVCHVLHNGQLLCKSNEEIKHLVHSNECRRQHITSLFPKDDRSNKPIGCYCCDVCSKTRDRSSHDKPKLFDPSKGDSQSYVSNKERSVTKEERELLHGKLKTYRDNLLKSCSNEFIPVGSIMILQEFDHYQIN